tara:strand:- start:9 stop:278 length:270 start_codon:yes stop_codon:yes gene_type:complete
LIESLQKKNPGSVDQKLVNKLDWLMGEMEKTKQEIQEERKKNHNDRWKKKILSLRADAILDETISEDMKERIILSLEEIAERIGMHEDL